MDTTGTIHPAWHRARAVLFQPFDIGKWFTLGLIFFLQSLLEGGGSFTYRTPSFRSSGSSPGAITSLRDVLDEVRTWVSANMGLAVALGVTFIVLIVGLALVLLWLGTRGQMMAIRAVMTGRAAVGEHWTETRAAGWSLFKVHLVLSLLGAVVWGPLAVVMGIRFVSLVDAGTTDLWDFAAAMLPFAVVGVAFALVMGLVVAVLRNFVAPVMLRMGLPAGAAWSRFRAAAQGSIGSIVMFFVIRAVFGVGVGIVATVITFCSCCIGGLPVVNQTFLAPWYFFERAWGLYALESLGPDMKMLDELPGPPVYPPPGFTPPAAPPPFSPWRPS